MLRVSLDFLHSSCSIIQVFIMCLSYTHTSRSTFRSFFFFSFFSPSTISASFCDHRLDHTAAVWWWPNIFYYEKQEQERAKWRPAPATELVRTQTNNEHRQTGKARMSLTPQPHTIWPVGQITLFSHLFGASVRQPIYLYLSVPAYARNGSIYL